MPLTEALIDQLKHREKPYKLNDSRGLCLLVTPNGGLWWRFRYRFGGKAKMISMGVYPETSLKEARSKRDEARAKVEVGVDPSEERREARQNTTVQTNVSFRLNLSSAGELTISTRTRTITLNSEQREALRAFLIAAPTDNKEATC